MSNQREIGAIILAGGKGKRMQLEGTNKVTLALKEKPMILRIVSFMQQMRIQSIIVVVGHARGSVELALTGQKVLYAVQEEQLGTGHAVSSALQVIPPDVSDVLVVYGDDAVLYAPENLPLIDSLFEEHLSSDASCTFLTIEQDHPVGLGRIVRDEKGKIQAIVEEKDATEEEKKLKEINPGCFLFRVSFLKNYLPMVEKSPVTGEYYLTSLIDLAILHGEHVQTVRGGKRKWRGVNTPEELVEAEKLVTSE